MSDKPDPRTLEQMFDDWFFDIVLLHGWSEAVRCGLNRQYGDFGQGLRGAEHLRTAISYNPGEYGCMMPWQREMCHILHQDRDPVAAYTYAANNAMSGNSWYRRRAEALQNMSEELRTSYFPVLRTPSAGNDTGRQWQAYGNTQRGVTVEEVVGAWTPDTSERSEAHYALVRQKMKKDLWDESLPI
jgi:hypothetical protein